MKSDSGGEMESCRSSDSETLNEITSPPVGTRERTLTNPPNQRHSISSEDSAGNEGWKCLGVSKIIGSYNLVPL